MRRDQRLVVRPRLWAIALGVLGLVAFTAAGILLLASLNPYRMLVGLVAVVFFGGGGVLVARRIARRGLSQMTLTPDGIQLAAGGLVPWADVEAIGVVRSPAKMLGIRLHRYDRYLASVPPAEAAEARQHTRWFLRPLALVAGMLGGPAGTSRRREALRGYASDVSSLEDGLRWNREHFGWDLMWSPAYLDRRTERFVDLMERYRAAARS